MSRDGETGKHKGLKIPRSLACGFESRSRYVLQTEENSMTLKCPKEYEQYGYVIASAKTKMVMGFDDIFPAWLYTKKLFDEGLLPVILKDKSGDMKKN